LHEDAELYEARYAGTYMLEHAALDVEWVRDMLAAVPATVRTVLDFGCGQARWAPVLGSVFPEAAITGIDISHNAVEKAEAQYPRGTFRWFDGTQAPFPEGQFDLVFSYHVLEHVSDLEQTVSEMVRVARSGGFIFAALPCGNPGSFEHRVVQLVDDGVDPQSGRFFFDDPGHLRRPTSRDLIEVVRAQGGVLELEFYAGQRWGAIEWLSRAQPEFVRSFLDPRRARGPSAAIQLRALRWAFLALSPFGRAYSYRDARARMASSTTVSERAKWALVLLAGLAATPMARALEALARHEWSRLRSRSDGSVQYLLFRKR
jgi:SAM-dependent methyltransferase